MNIQIIANWITGFCEGYFLFTLLETFMKWKDELPKYLKLAGIICVGILIDISNSFFTTGLMNIVFIIIVEYIATYLFNGSQKIRVISAILCFTLAIVTEVIILLFLAVIFDRGVNDIIYIDMFRLIGIILSKLLCYMCVKLISFKFKKSTATPDPNYWTLFAVMFGITILTMYTFCKNLEEGASEHIRNMTILCSFGLGIATIMILFLYERTLQQKALLIHRTLEEARLKEQMSHYNDIMMTQGEVKKVKHDLQNHLISIKSQLKRKEYSGCTEYIDTLLNYIDNSDSYIDTGNVVLDAIISAKKNEAEKNGINFNLDIRIPPNIPISKEDECIIFGNALDNALEACNRIGSDKFIDMSLIFDKDTLMCKIVNSYSPENEHNAITSKDDIKNHGIGNENIRKSLEKYDGIARVTKTNSEYTLFIIIGLKMKTA